MISLLKNLFLKKRGLDLIIVEYDVLPERLHGVDASRVGLLHQEDLSKTAFADNTLDYEVLQLRCLLLRLALEESIGPHLCDLCVLLLHLIVAAELAHGAARAEV